MPGLFDDKRLVRNISKINIADLNQSSIAPFNIDLSHITYYIRTEEKPRSEIEVPLTLDHRFRDTALFEDPKERNIKYYLPRYYIAEQIVNQEPRMRMRLTPKSLEIYLIARPAPKIAQLVKSTRASILPHKVDIQIRYKEGQESYSKSFQEVTFQKKGRIVKAKLKIASLNEADHLYKILTDASFQPKLTAERNFEAALYAPPNTTQVIQGPGSPRPVFRPDLKPVLVDPLAFSFLTPYSENALFRQTKGRLTSIIDDTFTFSPQLYNYIFDGVGSENRVNDLIRHPVQEDGNWFVYYQDNRVRNRFYFLPDRFELGNHAGQPLLALRFKSEGGYTLDELSAELDFIAKPIADEARLERHRTKLLQFATTNNPKDLTLAPLFDSDKLSYILQLGEESQSNPIDVSLQRGVFDTVKMTSTDFDIAWQSIFSTNPIQMILTGFVYLDIQSGIRDSIPIYIRLNPNKYEISEIFDTIFQTDRVSEFEKRVTLETFDDFSSVKAFIIDFGEQSIRLTKENSQATIDVLLPLRDTILGTENAGYYHYDLTVVKAGGSTTYEDLKANDEFLFIENRGQI